MKYLTLDCETTCLKLHPKDLDGNPFSRKNFLCYVGLLSHDGKYSDFDIEYSDEPYGDKLKKIQELIDEHDCLVGFNIKFDLHWLDRYGIRIESKRIFDTQLAEYIIRNQSIPYPSLHNTAIVYNLEGKLDVIKTEYWEKGIDTDEVPKDILQRYLKQDVEQTFLVFQRQNETIPDSKRRLVSIQNQDLVTLLEAEKNGMLYDAETSKAEGDKIQEQLNDINKNLIDITAFPHFDPASRDHISAILYGGHISIPFRESYVFTYKDGRTAKKLRWITKSFSFEQLVKPIKGSELKKEGFYATDFDTLSSLKATGKAKKIVDLILKRSELEKYRGTYLHGIPNLISKMDWEPNMIHGQLNQVVAITGRLSSSKPNLQNFDKKLGYLFKSRKGVLVNIDAKYLDWVAAVYLSQDAVGIQEIIDGFDLHSDNQKTFGLPSRLIAKKFLFRIIFGGTAYAFVSDPEFKEVGFNLKQWEGVIEKFYRKYKGIKKWHDQQIQKATTQGYLEIPTGRRWDYSMSKNKWTGELEWPITTIKNYPVQGLEADLMMVARVSLYNRIKHDNSILLINSVHDSILLDCPVERVEWLVNVLKSVFNDIPSNFKKLFGIEFNLPFRGEVSVGNNWLDMEEVK